MGAAVRSKLKSTLAFALGVICTGLLMLGFPQKEVLREAAGLEPSAPVTTRAALERFGGLVGEWRGVGQPRRGSNRDAWTEQAAWVWDFQQAEPALQLAISGGRLLKAARLEFQQADQRYRLIETTVDDKQRTYVGPWDGSRLQLTSEIDADGIQRRVTVTPLSEIRLVILHEATQPAKESFFRVVEVGYTRAGARLAGVGGGQPQCIVTGGLGTIEVHHAGRTYYVCCSGCKQAFEDDPERILREYRERLARAKQPTP